jgi:hypothetical protein
MSPKRVTVRSQWVDPLTRTGELQEPDINIRTLSRRPKTIVAAAITAALLIGGPTVAYASPWWFGNGGGHHHHHHSSDSGWSFAASPSEADTPDPSDTMTPTATPTATPSASSTPSAAASSSPSAAASSPAAAPSTAAASASNPLGTTVAPDAGFVENFDSAAAAGSVASTYSQAWQPYADGTSGIYYPSQTVSVHDGVMDVALGGEGAAGTFGTSSGAWDHVGGTFSVRAKATGGDGNGAAFMLWPTDGNWSEGEIDFPESNFEDSPNGYQHSMTAGQESNRTTIPTGVSWRDWHTYTINWVPGQSVTYSVDGTVLQTITHDVPTTAHRFMFQTGNWGASGDLLIDWVATS